MIEGLLLDGIKRDRRCLPVMVRPQLPALIKLVLAPALLAFADHALVRAQTAADFSLAEGFPVSRFSHDAPNANK